MQVEHVLVGEGDLRQVAAAGVHDALRLARRPRRVQQEEQLLAVERLGGALGIGGLEELVVPVVTTVLHRDVVAAPADDDHVLDRGALGDRLVGRRLEREHVAAAVAAVGRDEHLGPGVDDAVGQRLRREPTEHDAVGGADPGAGQHGDGCLRDHRQVDVDPITGLHAEAPQGVGQPLDLVQELGVGDRAGVTRLTLEVDGHLVAAAGGDVAVEAVVGDVELAADEPLGVRQLPVADRLPVGGPVEQLGGLPGPEALVVLGGLVVQLGARHQRVGLDALRRRERAVLGEQGVDGVGPVAATDVVGHGQDTRRRRGRVGSEGRPARSVSSEGARAARSVSARGTEPALGAEPHDRLTTVLGDVAAIMERCPPVRRRDNFATRPSKSPVGGPAQAPDGSRLTTSLFDGWPTTLRCWSWPPTSPPTACPPCCSSPRSRPPSPAIRINRLQPVLPMAPNTRPRPSTTGSRRARSTGSATPT